MTSSRRRLSLAGCLMPALAGCASPRIPFEQGDARYSFDVRADRDSASGAAVGTAAAIDLATRERLTIDRFEAPAGATSEFRVEDAATGARLELQITLTEDDVLYVPVVRRGDLLIASQQGTARRALPPAR